ncbi:MAG: hypothetical protein FJY97_17805 [candidate division Zixibacteria bacterium]|nr:hypothetical protein [candidate division Zixibacteria bacterium]
MTDTYRGVVRRAVLSAAYIAVFIAGLAQAQPGGFVPPETIAQATTVPLEKIPTDYPWALPPETAQTPPESLEALIADALVRFGDYLGLEDLPKIHLVDTSEWAAYVNFRHFVSLTAEGAPDGHGYNFNYYADKTPKSLPVGEITETGVFVMWKQVLAYYDIPRPFYASYLSDIVSHELRHYRQWQTLATEAMRMVGQDIAQTPRTRSDLSDEAFVTFMEKWGDIAHYQGRELDVYTAQVREGELPPALLAAPHVRHYYERAKGSRWREEFKASIVYIERNVVPETVPAP